MESQVLLPSFSVLRSSDVDEAYSWLRTVHGIGEVRSLGPQVPVPTIFNYARLPSLSVTFAQYGFHLGAKLSHSNFFVHGIPLAGGGKVVWNGNEINVHPSSVGIVGEPDSDAEYDYPSGFSHVYVTFAPEAVTRRLAALTGVPVGHSLRLRGGVDPAIAARQRRLVLFLASELEHCRDQMPDLVIAEIEDAIILNFLLETNHGFSHLLTGKTKAAAPWQVRRAVDYMEQHWDQPITIEKLTEITETSARSLFLLFKKTHDVSPMVYLSKVRLRHAHEMLSRPEPGISVTKVGFMCGFSNLGNFALKYFAAFGEKPSQTLKNSLR